MRHVSRVTCYVHYFPRHTAAIISRPLARRLAELGECAVRSRPSDSVQAVTPKIQDQEGLQSLRHTLLTEGGHLTQNVKALQWLAWYSNLATDRVYDHAEQIDVFDIAAVSCCPPDGRRDRPKRLDARDLLQRIQSLQQPLVNSASGKTAVSYLQARAKVAELADAPDLGSGG